MWLGYQRLVFRLKCWMLREDGQDLVEYALLIALIGAFLTASTSSLAYVLITGISNLATLFTATV
jgi:Flp pilus assembly pilin Flp